MLPRTTSASASTPGKMRLHVTRLDSLPSTTQAATLVVYDYDIYRSSQIDGKNGGGGGFWEIDATSFEGGGKIPGALQRHDVGPGTGVLAKVDLTFHHGSVPVASGPWYVDDMTPPAPPPTSAPEVVIEAPMKRGSTFEWAPIARVTLPAPDWASVERSGVATRRLALRIFAPDGQTILLSSRKQDHCGVFPTFFEATFVGRSTQSSSPTQPSAPGEPISRPGHAVPSPDPTGYFVEMVPGLTKAAQTVLVKNDNQRVVGASGLWLHAAGQGIVGWYYLMDGVVRGAPLFEGRLTDAKLADSLGVQMGSAFPYGVLIANPGLTAPTGVPADRRLSVPDRENVLPMLYLRGSTVPSAAPDPIDLLDGKVYSRMSELFFGYLELDHGAFGALDVTLHLKIGGEARELEFSRLYGRTRLPHLIFEQIAGAQSAVSQGELRRRAMAEVWPIPPGTRSWLMQKAGERIADIAEAYAEYVDGGANDLPSIQRGTIAGFAKAAAKVVTQLYGAPQYYTPDLVQLLASDVISRTIFVGGRNRIVREVLYEMLGRLLDLELGHAGRARGLPDEDFEWLLGRYPELAPSAGGERAGLVAIGINPGGHSYRYELTFSKQSLSGGAVVKGAGGGFDVTIKRFLSTTASTGTPDYEVTYFGAFLGIGAGAGAGFNLTKGGSAGSGGGAGGPVSCHLYSTARLSAAAFRHARFTTGAVVGPTVKGGTGVGLGIAAGWSKTFVELRVTSQSPTVLMNATLTGSPSEPSVSVPGVDSIKKHVDELKTKDPKKISTVGASVDLFAVSKSWGVLMASKGAVPKPNKDAPPEQGPGTRVSFIHRGQAVMAFEIGKADIRMFLVRRLDLLLAMYRKMFESPGWVRIEGYASPEWGELGRAAARAKNEQLADDRTDHTLAVIEEAIGKPGGPIVHPHKDVRSEGYGDAFQSRITDDVDVLKLNGVRAILDPFCPDASTAKGVDRRMVEQRDVYPTMRRVDISADGVFIIRLGAD